MQNENTNYPFIHSNKIIHPPLPLHQNFCHLAGVIIDSRTALSDNDFPPPYQRHHQCMVGCCSQSPWAGNTSLSLSLSLSFPFLFLSFSFPFHATTATTTNDPLLLPPLTGSDWAALVATDDRWQQPWVAGSGGGGDEERERNMERKRREGEVVGRREL